LEVRLPKEAKLLLPYLAADEPCRRRHVAMNLGRTDFQGFYRSTALAQERLTAACRRLENGEARAALKALDEALALDPGFLDAFLHRAVARERAGDAEGAGRDFFRALKAPGSAPKVEGVCACSSAAAAGAKVLAERIELGHEANARGIAHFRAGRSSAAVAAVTEAIARNPAGADAFQSRAVVRLASGDLAGALRDYESAARLSDGGPEVLAGFKASINRIKGRLAEERGPPPAPRARAAVETLAAVMPAKLGRAPAQYEWSLAELRGLWKKAAERTARFQRFADSRKTASEFALRLFAGEVEYVSVNDGRGRLLHLVLPDARVLPVSEEQVRAYLGGRGGSELLAGLGLEAERSTADMLGRGLAVYDLALVRLARELCPQTANTDCFERAAKTLRPQGVFSIPILDDAGGLGLKAAAAPALCLEYAEWQIASRGKNGALATGEAKAFLDAFLKRHMERLWRKAQNRMGPHQPWIFGGTMAEILAKSYPSAKDPKGGVLFHPKGREPLAVSPEIASVVRDAVEPWRIIAAAMERAPADELAPLSPYAAEELAEMGAVMAGVTLRRAATLGLTEAAALWDGEFEPAPAPGAAWFREIPMERSGLTLPFPEAPLRSWEAPGEMPGGLAILDYDRDGLPDLFFCDFEQARLYRNLGGFRFEEAVSSAGLSGVSCANGASSADYDGDGWPDLLALHDAAKRNRLLRNDHGRFVDATLEAGLSTGTSHATSAVWFDYDRDGRLDLFLAEAEDYRSQVEDVGELLNGRPDRLYRGLGSRFEEVSARAGLGDAGWGLAAVSFDYDNDGWPDLDVLNDFGVNRLYRNRRDGTFVEVSREAGVDSLGNGMGISAADFDHDGNLDLFVTYPGADRPARRYLFPEAARAFRLPYSGYFSGGSRYHQRNRLFRNSGDGTFKDDYPSRVDDVPTGWGWSGFFFDADNRGWQDLFQVSGWWADQFAFSDQTMVFWRYDPVSGRFRDASEASGLDFAADGRVGAYADLDGDGCLDVVATGFTPVRLFAGNCARSHHWLAVRLEGTRSNRDGIGARITVRSGPLTQTAEMGAQGGGFQSSLLREARFGLGESPRADSIEVVWPSGLLRRLDDVAADRVLVIREEP
ncbi:MAG: FG-GAP-like repeat-containing protein, partial [Elusimicrobia bacterium]|nr:FG-GAP-like repeat-containing protein [Elusimicrobiota bacterium]